MSRTARTSHQSDQTPSVPSRKREKILAGTALAIGAIVVVGVIGATTGSPGDNSIPETAELVYGRTEVAGLVVEGSTIDLGIVPLDVTVTPTWTITNTTTTPISLGEPHASVLDGCCPGPLTLADTVLQPGESTMLAFPLQMHAGMDGPHDFDVHLPIADSDDYLTLKVIGLFTG